MMAAADVSTDTLPMLPSDASNAGITAAISDPLIERRSWTRWWIALALTLPFAGMTFTAIFAVLFVGVGLWGINTTNVWGYAIANYVWWIGIGNAGTLISSYTFITEGRSTCGSGKHGTAWSETYSTYSLISPS